MVVVAARRKHGKGRWLSCSGCSLRAHGLHRHRREARRVRVRALALGLALSVLRHGCTTIMGVRHLAVKLALIIALIIAAAALLRLPSSIVSTACSRGSRPTHKCATAATSRKGLHAEEEAAC